MFKLLTEEAKGKVMGEYRARRAVVMLLALIFVLILSLVGLFPSYVLSNARQREVSERVQILGENLNNTEGMVSEAWLKDVNLKLRLLSPRLDQDRPSQLISAVLSERGSGVNITTLAWTKANGAVTLSLSGMAQDRQALLSLESRLSASEKFSGVTLPVSNLAKDKNLIFQIKLSPVQEP